MARYNGLIIPRSYNDYFSRSDPQAIRDIVSLAADGELNAESKNPLQNQAIAKIVPVTASPDNKLIVQSQVSGLTADVETIKNIIPNTASETNELADINFVNSTVGTNTANYIYTTESGGEKVPFSSVAELEAYAGTVTNNDYAFVTGIDENGNAYYDRYKADVNDGVVTWAKEYRLNNSSFTAEQWAAIQSGITAEKVAQFEGAVSPVDAVQSGNMSAVTSNAVYEALANYSNDKYLKNITPTNGFTREISFPLKKTNWFCGEVFGNLNNYGNICFYINVISATSISKTNIIGDSDKINITIDETNYSLKMRCSDNYSINSITFIHS